MAVFWLSFRISENKSVKGTYEKRYEKTQEVLTKHTSPSSKYWNKSTSFDVFRSSSFIEEIANDLKAALSSQMDLFLIRNMDVKDAIIYGNNEDNDIYDLMYSENKTYLKKLD